MTKLRPSETFAVSDWLSGSASNNFCQVLLALRLDPRVEHEADLFSRGCVESFRGQAFESYSYTFTQIFEKGVLDEVIALSRLADDDVHAIRHGEGAGIERLRSLVANAHLLSNVALSNTIAALVSISRFGLASILLNVLREREHCARSAFELGWIEFLIANRYTEGRDSMASFDRMRLAAATGEIPDGRVLDLCTQGVVWYLKRREVDEGTFNWCLATGSSLARQANRIDPTAVSSWFRGLAMLPASRRDSGMTRRCMDRARSNASVSITNDRSPKTLNAIKTYYESSIKEYLYVTPDRDLALEAATNLIDLDPYWAPSHGEKGEVFARFGEHDMAASCYEEAAALGPPYFAHHLLLAARSCAKAGDVDRASEHYTSLIGMAPSNVRLRDEAAALAIRPPVSVRRV